MRSFLSILMMLLVVTGAVAQNRTISGRVVDSRTQQGLPGALAIVVGSDDSAPKGTTTDEKGEFSFKAPDGAYTFRVTFLGYTTYEKQITVKEDTKMGTIRMKTEDKQIDEVKAVGVMKRQEQRGDTTVFNAEAFKVNPDATTEDLIKKMPGMQVSGGEVKSGGESVKRVLVDGKEYFGDDPMMALRNIQADMVAQIEVYDRQSDQSQFTGFSDGNEERTINILTKMGITSGRFGRVYAGYGTDSRYELGGNLNLFRGNHRVTLLGMLNNVNQQNFSFDDVTGAMSNGGMGMGGMFSMGQSGKNRTGSIGTNYTYEKEKKLKIEFSYFYNNNKNTSSSSSVQEYFLNNPNDSVRVYESERYSVGRNGNHRSTLRLTWTIDDNNSIIFTPRISWQKNTNEGNNGGFDSYDERPYLTTSQRTDSKTTGASANGDIMWRHKFSKDRRTLSLRMGGRINTSNSDNTSQSVNLYSANFNRNLNTSNLTENDSKTTALNASLSYTEPVGKIAALQINYSPSVTLSNSDKSVKADTADVTTMFVEDPSLMDLYISDYDKAISLADIDESERDYTFSPLLSNKKKSTYVQQRGGVGLNIFKGQEFNATIGLDFQEAILKGEQTYPYEFDTDKSFTSVLPSVMMRWRKGRTFNMRFNYRTSTSAPSINQLQKVVDVSNIRRYSTGNENLSQQYQHSLRLMTSYSNPETSRAIFLMLDYSASKDYITTSSLIAMADTVIDQGIVLPRGTQFDKPVNIDGYWTGRFNVTLSSPVRWLGSNANLNLGANLRHVPSLYNNKRVNSDTYTLNGGLTIGSSFSENVDFTVGYNGGYTIRKSTQTAQSNYNSYNHSISTSLNCIFFTRLVFTNGLSHEMTSGMGKDYDENYIKWNAGLGFKFFNDRRGELKLRVSDILDNAKSTSRNISTAYVETARTEVLGRYAMLTFTYKIKAKGQPQNNQMGPGGMMFMGPPPGGMGGGGMMRPR